MKNKFSEFLSLFLCLMLSIGTLAACSTINESTATASAPSKEVFPDVSSEGLESMIDFANAVNIDLSSLSCDSKTVKISDGEITLTKGGTYVLSGSLEGRVTVDADKEDIYLVLDSAQIKSNNSSAINVKDAKYTYIILKSGSENFLSDTENYSVDEKGDPDAALFCKNDLIIGGSGSLEITSVYDKGIHTKDTLTLLEGTVKVDSTGASVVAKDGISVENASLSLTSGKDALKTTNEENEALGNIFISGGEISIASQGDGIVSQNALTVTDGKFNIKTGGGAENADTPTGDSFGGPWRDSYSGDNSDSISLKALKASGAISISGGEFSLDSEDDALHSNDTVSISGGSFEIAAGDDGIHADAEADISGGNLDILTSYEGIEGMKVLISGGNIKLVSSDDGINAAGGSDSSNIGYGGPDSFRNGNTSDYIIEISGGNLEINASGDGIDSNGSLEIKDGTLYLSGPESGANSALDFESQCVISGGTVIAAGSSQMVEGISNSSTQCVASIFLSGTYYGNSEITLKSGAFTLSYTLEKSFSHIYISSPEMKVGESYSLYIDSIETENFTQDSIVTQVGSGGMSGMGGPGGMGPGGMGRY